MARQSSLQATGHGAGGTRSLTVTVSLPRSSARVTARRPATSSSNPASPTLLMTAAPAESLITQAGFDPVRTGTLARTDVGHQEPKGDLYGEEFHHDDAVAAVRRLRGTLPAGTGRP
jgi:hypothetical protein